MSVALRCLLRDQEPPGILRGQGVQGPSGAEPPNLEKNQQHCQLFPPHAEESTAMCESPAASAFRLPQGEPGTCWPQSVFRNGSWTQRKFPALSPMGRAVGSLFQWSLLVQGFLLTRPSFLMDNLSVVTDAYVKASLK